MTRRWRGSRSSHSQQLQIDWKASSPSPPEPSATAESSWPGANGPEPLVQRLPWDFETTFPQPTVEALDAGTFFEEDATPQRIRALHVEHAHQALGVLHDLDKVMDARRNGTDPKTGKPPRTHARREKLRGLLDVVQGRLERSWISLMGVYEEVFGPQAADAFTKAIRARHAGIDVVAEREPAVMPPWLPMSPQIVDTKAARSEVRPDQEAQAHRSTRRISCRLPLPRPLASAIVAGHFGRENGKPVRPGPAEVRAITEQHAEKLIDLLDRLASAPSTSKDALQAQVAAGIAAYAEDFGEPAAQQLEAYVARQTRLDVRSRRER